MTQWLAAFLLTQACEVPVYRRAGARWGTALLASTLTHPVVWFVFPQLDALGLGYWEMVAVAETFAVGVEALWLFAHRVRRPLAWSLLANAASVAVGLLLRELFGWP